MLQPMLIHTQLYTSKTDQLFVVHTKGDDQGTFAVHPRHPRPTSAPVRTSLPRYSKRQLTSTKILSQRSAVPAVVSRGTTPSGPKKISRADKQRLLRIAKRPRKGPFSRGHDLWDVPAVEEIVPEGLETVRRRTIVVRCPYPRHERDSSL